MTEAKFCDVHSNWSLICLHCSGRSLVNRSRVPLVESGSSLSSDRPCACVCWRSCCRKSKGSVGGAGCASAVF